MNNQPVSSLLEKNKKQLPKLEILILSKESDFSLLPLVVRCAVDSTENPIDSVRIIVPDRDLKTAKKLKLISPSDSVVKVDIYPDSDFLSDENAEVIKENLPERFGWIAQQVIANVAIQKSEERNVLLVDADTLLIRKQTWLNNEGCQILMPSEEYHTPYYEFLGSLSSSYSRAEVSFVSHHMLYQVDILRDIMEQLGGINRLLRKAIDWTPKGEQSPFDLKYEPYAQYIFQNLRERVSLQKWANSSLRRWENYEDPQSFQKLKRLSKFYNSVSFHHWNVNKGS